MSIAFCVFTRQGTSWLPTPTTLSNPPGPTALRTARPIWFFRSSARRCATLQQSQEQRGPAPVRFIGKKWWQRLGRSYCWLVVYLPLWKIMEFVSWDDDIPNIWKKKCSKPPIRLGTRIVFFHLFLPTMNVVWYTATHHKCIDWTSERTSSHQQYQTADVTNSSYPLVN